MPHELMRHAECIFHSRKTNLFARSPSMELGERETLDLDDVVRFAPGVTGLWQGSNKDAAGAPAAS